MREFHAGSLGPVELSGSLCFKVNIAVITQDRLPLIYYLTWFAWESFNRA